MGDPFWSDGVGSVVVGAGELAPLGVFGGRDGFSRMVVELLATWILEGDCQTFGVLFISVIFGDFWRFIP